MVQSLCPLERLEKQISEERHWEERQIHQSAEPFLSYSISRADSFPFSFTERSECFSQRAEIRVQNKERQKHMAVRTGGGREDWEFWNYQILNTI